MIASLDEKDFSYAPANKWTAGQQLDHILRSVAPLKMVFGFPKLLIGLLFGKANRPSKTYAELIGKYHLKLARGGRASGRFIPQAITFSRKEQLSKALLITVKKLTTRLDGFSEQQLDRYILPHPLLGKLTLREMMYFTIYHVEHHQRLVIQGLESNVKKV